MKPIMREGIEVLERFAASNVLLAFDYDGTLAPIVRDPDEAHPNPSTQALLARLTVLFPCAVISGRARADALKRLGEVQLWGASGNHGAEILGRPERYELLVQDWAALFRESLADHPGVLIEDKRFSVSVHYRNATDERAALAAIEQTAARLEGARVLPGKKVVNAVPAGAPDKGVALDCMRRWSGCDTAVYVGDDVTDEDAFALASEEVLAIRVGPSPGSRAPWYLEDQREVDKLLERLVACRATPASRAPGSSGSPRTR